MAADPFAFYRGTACLFYADMSTLEDRWSDERTSRAWIQGDLHAENFGTYMDISPSGNHPRADQASSGGARASEG